VETAAVRALPSGWEAAVQIFLVLVQANTRLQRFPGQLAQREPVRRMFFGVDEQNIGTRVRQQIVWITACSRSAAAE